ncbi:hypothetical protein I79_017084 [Cricetulus griseus]|uniref:Uncharacterized protein n=1 Tax=Cricetulus griseus TaxID=10029 RepID=G3I138_CRIGR|nr:hypothetical protein I79_017084 [Cricetulus griseus]
MVPLGQRFWPLTSISMPPLLMGTCEAWEDMKLCLFGNRLGRYFWKVTQPFYLPRETGQNGTPASLGC